MPAIPRALFDAMVEHSRELAPFGVPVEQGQEACGVIHAIDGRPVALHRVTNAAASPYRYEMAPQELLSLERRLGRRRRRVPAGQPGGGRFAPGFDEETRFAIYHSHLASQARPSPTDVRMAFWPPGDTQGAPLYPDAYYIVVSLAKQPPEARAFRIRPAATVEECIEEEPLTLVD